MWALKKENKRPTLKMDDVFESGIINIKVE
jgi:hypothetical protein